MRRLDKKLLVRLLSRCHRSLLDSSSSLFFSLKKQKSWHGFGTIGLSLEGIDEDVCRHMAQLTQT